MDYAAEPRSRCDSCGAIVRNSELLDVKDILERVAPGELMPSGECPTCHGLCHPHDQTIRDEHYQLFVDKILADNEGFRSVDECDLGPDDRFVIALDAERRVNDWDTEPELRVIAVGDSLVACQEMIADWRDDSQQPIAACDLNTGMAFGVHVSNNYRLSNLAESVKDK